MLGEYTVNVYVQGSDNTTINKTYKYTATNSDVTVPTTAPVPATTAPVPTTTAPVPATTAPVPATTSPVPTTTTSPVVVLGDVDGNGKLTVNDATYIQKYLAEFPEYSSISLKVGDVNGDGKISVKDATAIQLMLTK